MHETLITELEKMNLEYKRIKIYRYYTADFYVHVSEYNGEKSIEAKQGNNCSLVLYVSLKKSVIIVVVQPRNMDFNRHQVKRNYDFNSHNLTEIWTFNRHKLTEITILIVII